MALTTSNELAKDGMKREEGRWKVRWEDEDGVGTSRGRGEQNGAGHVGAGQEHDWVSRREVRLRLEGLESGQGLTHDCRLPRGCAAGWCELLSLQDQNGMHENARGEGGEAS